MPSLNPKTGEHGLRAVTDGDVFWHQQNKVTCIDHGAMNAVNPDRTIWRCIHAVAERKDGSVVALCGRGAYVEWA